MRSVIVGQERIRDFARGISSHESISGKCSSCEKGNVVSKSVRIIPHADCAVFQNAQSIITRLYVCVRFAQLLLADASVTASFIGSRLKPVVSLMRPLIGVEVLVLGSSCNVQSVYFVQHRQGVQSISVPLLCSKLVNGLSLFLSKGS
jgi:hypothetical protein